MYPAIWPIGTCHFIKLPPEIRLLLIENHVVDGIVDPSLKVHQTPSEGPYIEFCGYKVRVALEHTSNTTYNVKIA